MDTIYLVTARTGEYSDRHEWPVRAFADGKEARVFAASLIKWARANSVHTSQEGGMPDYHDREKIGDKCPAGPCGIDYTGIDWTVTEVPFGTVPDAGDGKP
jgi:hypothetical protein